jgi:hypothetical protein
MKALIWWMRVVGLFYLFLFVAAAILRVPIDVEGPDGILQRAAAGDPTARFVVESWVTYGLVLGAIGVGLLAGSRAASPSRALVWMLIGIEGALILADCYKLARGYPWSVTGPWLVIHPVIIGTGLFVLSRSRTTAATFA